MAKSFKEIEQLACVTALQCRIAESQNEYKIADAAYAALKQALIEICDERDELKSQIEVLKQNLKEPNL